MWVEVFARVRGEIEGVGEWGSGEGEENGGESMYE